MSVHKAAAGVIARRSQGYNETVPRQISTPVTVKGVTTIFRLPARNRSEDGGALDWGAIHVALGKFRREILAAQRKAVARLGTSRGVKSRGSSAFPYTKVMTLPAVLE
jgi:hypothetical protein